MSEPPPRAVVSEVVEMEQETDFVIYEGVVVPESALLQRERRNPYGSVPGLDDEELADPDELERQVYREEFGQVLALPLRGRGNGFRPELDEDGVEWGAFASVDFERTMPEFDRARHKADKLREELNDVFIMFGIVEERLPKARRQVLKYLEARVIELEHMATDDMLALGKLYLRAIRLQREIRKLKGVSWKKMRKQLAEVLP